MTGISGASESDKRNTSGSLAIATNAGQAVRPPRIWTALTAPIVATVVGTFAAIAFAVIGLLIFTNAKIDFLTGEGRVEFTENFEQFVNSIPGYLVARISVPLALLGVALVAAHRSPVPIIDRLSLHRPCVGASTCALWVVATPFFLIQGSYLSSLVPEFPIGQFAADDDVFQGVSTSSVGVLLAVTAIVPSFCEVVLFQGYMQSRLLQRWHPLFAIVVSGLYFSVSYVEPSHLFAMIPIALWLSTLAWWSRSVWPSVACHATGTFFGEVWEVSGASESALMEEVFASAILISSTAALIAVALLGRGRQI